MKSAAILWLLHDMARVMRAERDRQQGVVVPFPGRRRPSDKSDHRHKGGVENSHREEE